MGQNTDRNTAPLLARVEELFADSESIVVAAFEVGSCSFRAGTTAVRCAFKQVEAECTDVLPLVSNCT